MNMNPVFTAVKQATVLCQTVQQQYGQHMAEKAKADPVTLADYGSQAIICRMIQEYFPGEGVIAEEGAEQFASLLSESQQSVVAQLISDILHQPVSIEMVQAWLDHGRGMDSVRKWVIDPIDGTKGYIAGRNYAIAIGILDHGKPAAGIMGTPGYAAIPGGALFFTQDGKAFLQPLVGGEAQPIVVANRSDPASIIFAESIEKSHGSQDTMAEVRRYAGMEQSEIIRLDSQEKYCLVACGDADAYLRLPRSGSTYHHKIWDHAAGVAIVEAAGGLVSDVDGSPLDFSLGSELTRNKGMIVANPAIHPLLVEAASKITF